MSNPKDFLLDQAKNLSESGHFEDAIKNLDEIKNLYENQDRNFWFNKGQHYLKLENYTEAISCFDKDLDLNKKSYRTFFFKGVAQYFNTQYHEAVESFNRAWEVKYADFLKNLDQAKNLQNVKKFERAVEYYDTANMIDSIETSFWYYKGLSLFQIGRYDESRDSFEKAMQKDPENSEIYYNLAKCDLQSEKLDSCVLMLKKACQLDSSKKDLIKNDTLFSGMPQENFEKIFE